VRWCPPIRCNDVVERLALAASVSPSTSLPRAVKEKERERERERKEEGGGVGDGGGGSTAAVGSDLGCGFGHSVVRRGAGCAAALLLTVLVYSAWAE